MRRGLLAAREKERERDHRKDRKNVERRTLAFCMHLARGALRRCSAMRRGKRLTFCDSLVRFHRDRFALAEGRAALDNQGGLVEV